MPIAYYLNCKNGNKYKDQNGQEREGTMQVGRVVTTQGGGLMCIIDGLPFAALSSKEPIVLFMNPPRDKESTDERPARREASHAPPPPSDKSQKDLGEDIPFMVAP